jgi:hypothetical protein
MAKAAPTVRKEARRLYLTGEMSSNAEIASHLRVKPHTVGLWRREEDWDGLKRKIDRRAAEMLVEKIATDRVTLNEQHFKLWSLVVTQLLEGMKAGHAETTVRTLERVSGILDRAQKGQRLARGLALDGQTEELIRAEAQAEIRHLIDTFIDAVKENVPDEEARERIRRALLEAVPDETGQRAGDGEDESSE